MKFIPFLTLAMLPSLAIVTSCRIKSEKADRAEYPGQPAPSQRGEPNAIFPGHQADEGKWFVSVHGDDANHGRSPASPFRTLTRSLQALEPGDTLVVGAGTYYARPLKIHDLPSTPENPIRIVADPRGAATVSSAWPKAAEGQVEWEHVGDGIYRTRRDSGGSEKETSIMGGWNGHFLNAYLNLEELRESRGSYLMDTGMATQGPRWGFAVEDNDYYLRLPGRVDPSGERVVFASFWPGHPSHWDREWYPIVEIKNSPGLIFDGLRFEGARVGLHFDEASHHAVIRNCIFEYVADGALLSHDSVVEWCELTFPGLSAVHEDLVGRWPGGDRIARNRMFRLFKMQPIEGGIAGSSLDIDDNMARRVTTRYNYIHDVIDGDRLGAFKDSASHHNVYVNTFDNAVEINHFRDGQKAVNLHFHDNLIRGLSHGAISHLHQLGRDATANVGPHFVYRNVVFLERGGGVWNPWTLSKFSLKHRREDMVGVHYFNNLILALEGNDLIFWERDEVFDRLHFYNNIFVWPVRTPNPQAEEMPHMNHNLLVAPEDNPAVTGPSGVWTASIEAAGLGDLAAFDFALRQGSPAIGAGRRIDGFHDPDAPPPDLGPFPYGQPPYPEWPRPARRLYQSGPVGSVDFELLREFAEADYSGFVVEVWEERKSEIRRRRRSWVETENEE